MDADYINELVQISADGWLSDVARRPTVVFRFTSLVAQYHAALAGVGIAMLRSFVAARENRLVPVPPTRATVKLDFWLPVHHDLTCVARIIEVVRRLTELIEGDQPFHTGDAP